MANKTPDFFTIILEDAVQEKLVIPKSFLRVYGNYLLEKAFLKVRDVGDGENWQVDVIKSSDNVWFGNGWKEFADYYSVSYGTYLKFEFEDIQNCIFNVSKEEIMFKKKKKKNNPTPVNHYSFTVKQEDNVEEEQVHHQVPVNEEENSNTDVLPIEISSEDDDDEYSPPREISSEDDDDDDDDDDDSDE